MCKVSDCDIYLIWWKDTAENKEILHNIWQARNGWLCFKWCSVEFWMNQRCLSPISISDRNFSFLYISSVELKRGYMSDVGKDSFKNVFLMLVWIAL